jgi:hypothetical protein
MNSENFKIVKFLKIEWIKNLTQGGAQDYLEVIIPIIKS